MQVLPETAQAHGVRNLTDVAANLRAGTRHLSSLMERFDNRLELALAAYNAGEGAVRRHNNNIPPYPETRHYVPAVVSRYRANSPIAAVEAPPKPATHDYLPGTRLDPQSLQQLP
jgi:soluble lytic murein transglycosylase-like protein